MWILKFGFKLSCQITERRGMISYKVKKWSEVAQSCQTLCDPTDCSPPGSSIHVILQAKILEWVDISFSRGSSWPRSFQTQVSRMAGKRFTLWATKEVAKSCPTRWEPIDCRTPGFPVLHHLLEFTLTHVHRVGDTIQDVRTCFQDGTRFYCRGITNSISILIVKKECLIHWKTSG